MNVPSLFLALIVASVTCSAESPLEKELKQLTSQRDAAIASASDPINRKYQAALEPLLKRATQSNDLDAAIKIREALSRAAAAAPTSEPKANLVALLTSGRWEWYTTTDLTGTAYHVTFGADNQCSIEPGKQFLTKWEALNSRQVRIDTLSGNYYVFDIDWGKKVGLNNIKVATQKEPKSMRLERK